MEVAKGSFLVQLRAVCWVVGSLGPEAFEYLASVSFETCFAASFAIAAISTRSTLPHFPADDAGLLLDRELGHALLLDTKFTSVVEAVLCLVVGVEVLQGCWECSGTLWAGFLKGAHKLLTLYLLDNIRLEVVQSSFHTQ